MAVPHLVAVDAPLSAGDVAFTYAAPHPLAPGTAVLVPFGRRLALGYVLGWGEPYEGPVRQIITALGGIPPLTPDLLALAWWMAEHYVCTAGEALATMLPGGIFADVRLSLTATSRMSDLPARVRDGRPLTVRSLQRALAPGSAARLQAWVGEGRVHLAAVLPGAVVETIPGGRPQLTIHPALWPDRGGGSRRVLLLSEAREGTYLAGLREAVGRGRAAIIVFASTQEAERFAARVPDVLRTAVAIVHGDVPEEERLRRWLAIRAGIVRVVVGTRQAVFAPCPDLGIIAVDDEADVGHVEERVPRYHAGEVAQWRAAWGEEQGAAVQAAGGRAPLREGASAGADLILADVVPRAETYAEAAAGRFTVLPASADRPEARARVAVVDLRRPRSRASLSGARTVSPDAVLSPPLVEAVQAALEAGGNVLLFVHRKGYAAVLVCAECGHSPRCERCDVPLAFDARERVLRCRYCRDRFEAPAACPACGGISLLPGGTGLQRVAHLAARVFNVRVHRLDADLARTPDAVAAILGRFREDGGVLVATPLVLQATPPPRVDVAGIVLADASLRHPDYRAGERGLRVLWRVRALARSQVIVQTYAPDHPALLALQRGDLRFFYRAELRTRRLFRYPPYGEVVAVEMTGPADRARSGAEHLAEGALRWGAEVLGPAAVRRGPRARWQIVLKGVPLVARAPLVDHLRGQVPRAVHVAVEVNP